MTPQLKSADWARLPPKKGPIYWRDVASSSGSRRPSSPNSTKNLSKSNLLKWHGVFQIKDYFGSYLVLLLFKEGYPKEFYWDTFFLTIQSIKQWLEGKGWFFAHLVKIHAARGRIRIQEFIEKGLQIRIMWCFLNNRREEIY